MFEVDELFGGDVYQYHSKANKRQRNDSGYSSIIASPRKESDDPMLSDFSNDDPGDTNDPYSDFSSPETFYRTTNILSQSGFINLQLNSFVEETPNDWNQFDHADDLNLFSLAPYIFGNSINDDTRVSAGPTNKSLELGLKTELCTPDCFDNDAIEELSELNGDSDNSSDYHVINSIVGAANYSEVNKASGFAFLKGCNAIQKFKITVQDHTADGRRRPFIKGMWELDEIVQLMLKFGEHRLSISKPQLNKEAVDKFCSKDLDNKRSGVSCHSIQHGIALAIKWEELQAEKIGLLGTDRKMINNKFTNYVRSNRKAGNKLEMDFLKKYLLSKTSSYEEIEINCDISLIVFNNKGMISYSPSVMGKDKIIFFLETETNLFWIKNIKGFCRNH